MRPPLLVLALLLVSASAAPVASADAPTDPCEGPAGLCPPEECFLNNPQALLEAPVSSVLACANMTR